MANDGEPHKPAAADAQAADAPANIPHWILSSDNREQRALLLSEWATMVQPALDNAADMRKHSVAHALVAIQSTYVLNGGALAALPPLMSGLSKAGGVAIAWSSMPFVFGIVSAGLCSLFAYLNFQWHGQFWEQGSNERAAQIVSYYFTNPSSQNSPASQAGLASWINASFYIALFAAVASLVFFVFGAFSFIHLAIQFPLVTTK